MANNIEDIPKPARELVAEAKTYIEENRPQIKEIANNKEYQLANEIYKNVKFYEKILDIERKKATKPLDDAKSIIIGWFQPSQEDLVKMEICLKANIGRYENLNERKRREESELNKRKARAEEEKRKKDLEDKKREEDRKRGELETKKKEEERKIIVAEENAKKEEANGNNIKASELKNEAKILRERDEELELAIEFQEVKIETLDNEKNHILVQPEEPKTPELPKIIGVHRRRKWDYRVTNKDLVPEPYIIIEKNIDDKKLRKIINQTDGQITIPGIEIFEEKIISRGEGRYLGIYNCVKIKLKESISVPCTLFN